VLTVDESSQVLAMLDGVINRPPMWVARELGRFLLAHLDERQREPHGAGA
jgi:hypothetical protein